MTSFGVAQQQVLALDPTHHARILGAPGTGKSTLVIESFARVSAGDGIGEGDVLVLAANRLSAARIRELVHARVARAMGGSPVRTASSFAFSVLTRVAAVADDLAPRLLTGTVQDEAIAAVIEAHLAAQPARGETASETADPVGLERPPAAAGQLAPEVLLSAPFRAELRELWRVLDDFGLDPRELDASLATLAARDAAARSAYTGDPDPGLVLRWREALGIIAEVSGVLQDSRGGELSASGLLAAATRAVRDGAVTAPRLLLVDDAQELGEGQLALLAACAGAGSSVWVFGDPDVATSAFQGEHTRVLAGLSPELARRGWVAPPGAREQVVVLDTVYRHGPALRSFVRDLSGRIGSAGTAPHRLAPAAEAAERGVPESAGPESAGPESAGPESAGPGSAGLDAAVPESAAPEAAMPESAAPEVEAQTRAAAGSVEFARVDTPAEQIGVIAHRMRARKLGLDAARRLDWNEMAVVCRTRAEVTRVARLLAGHQVPTGVAAGGIVLREHQIVRELIALLTHALGIRPLDAAGVLRLAGGVIGGLDAVAVRRLRGALLLDERRMAREAGRDPLPVEAVVFEAFEFPGPEPVVDSAGGRALRKLGLMAAAGTRVQDNGGTPREVLWALWDGAKLADRWQQDALSGRGLRADEANRSLDAVVGLFFALQRHEEQDSEQPIAELLDDLLRSTVPEDSLARRSERHTVTVTTPQGMIGREFALVAVIGVQDGSWPNLRARGSLLGTAALERWLRGGEAMMPSRRDTTHDELRLFLQACSRAREELLVVAVADEDSHPSPFFGLGHEHLVAGLPSSRLTLRGITAAMRRRVVEDPSDALAVDSLAALAVAGVSGANPDDWYGIAEPSSVAPLYAAREGEEPRHVPVSPSQLEKSETCPLDWVIGTLGGSQSNVQASLGTLVHHALETVSGHDPEEILAAITSEWRKLPFDAEWESERARRTAQQMAEGLSDYLREFAGSGRELLGQEASFSLEIGRAKLSGIADRLEATRTPGGAEITVVDLKTGRTPATKPEAEQHVQLQAYQLGALSGAFSAAEVLLAETGAAASDGSGDCTGDGTGAGTDTGASAATAELTTRAKLLYVHPDAAKGKGFVEREQSGLTAEARELLLTRVAAAADTMAAAGFTARIEHHCSDPHRPGNCRLHIIQAVSHA